MCDISGCEQTGVLQLSCVRGLTCACAFVGGGHHENECGQGAGKRPEAVGAWQPGRCIASRCLTVRDQCSQTEEEILVEKLQGKEYKFLLRITSWQELLSLAFSGTLPAGWHLWVISSRQGEKEVPWPRGSISQATLTFTRTHNFCGMIFTRTHNFCSMWKVDTIFGASPVPSNRDGKAFHVNSCQFSVSRKTWSRAVNSSSGRK